MSIKHVWIYHVPSVVYPGRHRGKSTSEFRNHKGTNSRWKSKVDCCDQKCCSVWPICIEWVNHFVPVKLGRSLRISWKRTTRSGRSGNQKRHLRIVAVDGSAYAHDKFWCTVALVPLMIKVLFIELFSGQGIRFIFIERTSNNPLCMNIRPNASVYRTKKDLSERHRKMWLGLRAPADWCFQFWTENLSPWSWTLQYYKRFLCCDKEVSRWSASLLSAAQRCETMWCS